MRSGVGVWFGSELKSGTAGNSNMERERRIIMAASSVRERLESCAISIGYTGKVKAIPREVASNTRVAGFLEWLCDRMVSGNAFSTSALERFEALKSAGSILEGTELREALGKIEDSSSDRKTDKQLRSEISNLKRSVEALKTQLQTLKNIQDALSDHQAQLLIKKEMVDQTHTKSLSSYQTALHTGQNDNKKVNLALEELQSAVENVTSFHQPTDAKEGVRRGGEGGAERGGSLLFSHVISEDYSSAEDTFLSELTSYTKKQFFKGIAAMAHTTPEDDDVGISWLADPNDPTSVLMKGSSREQYASHCKELTRLKNLYPLVEAQRVSELLAQRHAEAVGRRVQDVVEELRRQTTPLDPPVLRRCIGEKEKELSQLQSQTGHLATQQLPGLIQDMATLQVSTILHGDYDLKIARQDYFTSKQEKVISYLLSQTARQELLSMLYEVELRRHRDTHRLLSATISHLHSLSTSRDKRTRAMESSGLQPVREARKTVDSRDKFGLRICSLLGLTPSSPDLSLTHDSLKTAVRQLVQQTASLEAILSAQQSEQLQTLQEVEATSEILGKNVFGPSGTGGPAQLTLKEFEEECTKLESVLGSMERNVKRLLTDFDTKKKCLQGNELIERERKLFVYFFTDPVQLNRELSELGRRIDALSTAAKQSSL